MGQAARNQQPQYPVHEYAADHILYEKYLTCKPPSVRAAEKIRPSGEIACERIRELGFDLGAELEWNRWMADVATKLGLTYETARLIFNGERISVSTRTVDRVHRKTGIPIAVFYDVV